LSRTEDESRLEKKDEVRDQMMCIAVVVTIVSNNQKEDTFNVRFGGRVDLRSADRALVRMCSDIGVFEVGVAVKSELFGTDFEGMWPLGGLLGGIGGNTGATFGGDRGGCIFIEFIDEVCVGGGRDGGGGWGLGDAARLDLGGDTG
jgi:hypothetical protein